jgi:hypothetical protein
MPIAGISLGTGLGGGTSATSSGAPGAAAAGFNIDVRDTEANILARTGDATGVIAFGTDTLDLYVYDGTNWQIYENS